MFGICIKRFGGLIDQVPNPALSASYLRRFTVLSSVRNALDLTLTIRELSENNSLPCRESDYEAGPRPSHIYISTSPVYQCADLVLNVAEEVALGRGGAGDHVEHPARPAQPL